jgi:hypothetical protein
VDTGVAEQKVSVTHDSLLTDLVISSPLGYKVYLHMFPFTSGELLDMTVPLIQKRRHNHVDCCATPQTKLHTNMFVQRVEQIDCV